MESQGSFLTDISCVVCNVCEACSTLDQRGKGIFHIMSNVHHITESAVSFPSFHFKGIFITFLQQEACGKWSITWINKLQSPAWPLHWYLKSIKGVSKLHSRKAPSNISLWLCYLGFQKEAGKCLTR